MPDAEARGARVYELERAHRRVARQADRFRRRAQGEQPLEDWQSSRRSAPGLDWAGVLRGRRPLGPADDHGLAPGRGHRHLRRSPAVSRSTSGRTTSPSTRSTALRALLPAAFADERFRFYGTALSGAQKPRDRWKRAVDATSGALGDAVGRLYVEKYFSAEDKAAVPGDGQEHRRRVRPADRQARLDVAGDAGEGQGQARHAVRRHRLSGPLDRLHRARDPQGRRPRQRAAGGALHLPPEPRQARASPWTRRSGA